MDKIQTISRSNTGRCPNFRLLGFSIILSLLIFQHAPILSQENQTQHHLNESVERYPNAGEKKAVTLVVHGLNVQPAAMLDIVQWLNKQGSDAFLVKLAGHRESAVAMPEITADAWQSEMEYAYRLAQQTAADHKVPLFFVGFSLGGLLGPAMVSRSGGQYTFDRQLLLAPAIGLRTRSYLVKLSFFLGAEKTLPSFTPKQYRANNKLPIRFYKIMFREERLLKKNKFRHTNIPTLVVIDPSDELISYQKLHRLSTRFQLTNFRFIQLDSQLGGRETKYHHLVINERTMGEKNWTIFTREMSQFLFND